MKRTLIGRLIRSIRLRQVIRKRVKVNRERESYKRFNAAYIKTYTSGTYSPSYQTQPTSDNSLLDMGIGFATGMLFSNLSDNDSCSHSSDWSDNSSSDWGGFGGGDSGGGGSSGDW